MRITRKRLPLPDDYSVPLGFTLISDIHFGSSSFQPDLLKMDLERARAAGDRIAINGDVFDLILPSDRKRFDISSVDDRMLVSSMIDEQLELGIEHLAPYAHLIDMIGVGNHEQSAIKYHHTDLVSRLVNRLNRYHGGNIVNGGWTGFLDYRASGEDSTGKISQTRRLVIFYHHGSGGASPITKGMIDFSRLRQWVDADVIWIGHKHNRIIDAGAMRMRCPIRGDEPKFDPVLCVMTGAYTSSYDSLVDDYAAQRAMAPQQGGGVRVLGLPKRGGTAAHGWSKVWVEA